MRQLKITKQVTVRDEVALDKYLNDISPIPLITAEREAELAYRIRTEDDREAHAELVRSNLRFVVSVAKQYQNQGLSLPDLINEGNLGLMKAADRFDETKGFKFISYAVWWVRQHILQGLAQQGRTVRLPQNKIGTLGKLRKASSELTQDLERKPTVYELAEYMDITVDEVHTCLKHNKKSPSLDAPLTDDSKASTLIDLLSDDEMHRPDEQSERASMAHDIEQALNTLTPREARVIRLTYGIGVAHPYTLDEISEDFGVTRERVRQIKEKALRRLRNTHINNNLKQHLG